jgi:DNA-binding XRE family transcriptional regulator
LGYILRITIDDQYCNQIPDLRLISDERINMITPQQCRAARAWLDWKLDDLVEKSAVSKGTLNSFERGVRVPHDRTLRDVARAFEEAGIELLFDGPRGIGLRLTQ